MCPFGWRVGRTIKRLGLDVETRDVLLHEVWGYNASPTTRTVDNFIASLRKKIELDASAPAHIHTVRGIGYRLTDAGATDSG